MKDFEKKLKEVETTKNYYELKDKANEWLGEGWRQHNCWASFEAMKLASVINDKLTYMEKVLQCHLF